MGNETSRASKRITLLRKKSPSAKDQVKAKPNKAASLSSLPFGRRMSSSGRQNRKKQQNANAKGPGNDLVQTLDFATGEIKNNVENPNGNGRSREISFEEQMVQNSLKTRVCLDDFTLVKTVGKGSFGRVIQVKKKDSGTVYAMKVLKKEQVIKRKQFEHTMAERRILEDIDHPFIVSLRFAFQTSQKLFMVFDFFNGGELFHYLSKTGRFGEERAKLYSAEILLGIEHVHKMNIIYRDLKPENLLLDSDGHIRITDFGLSKENVTDDSVKSFCGTPEYLAPEVLRRQKYGKAVDWWSLGTLLYEMISGLPPFYDRNRERMYKKVLTAELRFPTNMTPEARSICRGMLQRDPQQRLGYRGAQEIKSHPFYSDLNWDDVYYKRITPKFVPNVSSVEDTRNVDKAFTSIPACVTPTPHDSKLIDKEFKDFTFTASNALDLDRNSQKFNLDFNGQFNDMSNQNPNDSNVNALSSRFNQMNMGMVNNAGHYNNVGTTNQFNAPGMNNLGAMPANHLPNNYNQNFNGIQGIPGASNQNFNANINNQGLNAGLSNQHVNGHGQMYMQNPQNGAALPGLLNQNKQNRI